MYMKKATITLYLLAGIVLLGAVYVQRAEKEQEALFAWKESESPVVILDAGHGGPDPGKVGVNGVLEKDINLQIALRIKSLLEQNDVTVILTRATDTDLASENAKSRKNEDLRARIRLMEETEPILAVSIHQNSFPEEDVDGAQVFYYSGSEEGKRLGNILQEQLKTEANTENHRIAKANRDYYLLKKATCPAVIVECGFLSNPQEAELLASEEYQEKIAFAVHLGILEYMNTMEE